jgi:hypothetical protein
VTGATGNEYADAVRDVIALIRAWNSSAAVAEGATGDDICAAFNGGDIRAILAGADPYKCLAVLLSLNYELMASISESNGEADPQRAIETMLFALQSSAEMHELTGGGDAG